VIDDLEARAREVVRGIECTGDPDPNPWDVMNVKKALELTRAEATRDAIEAAAKKARAVGMRHSVDGQIPGGFALEIEAAIRAMAATEGEKPMDSCGDFNLLRDALAWFDSHEVEQKLGHMPWWVKMARERSASVFPASPQPPAHEGAWDAVSMAISEYLDGYEFRGDGGDHKPTDEEIELIDDVISGLIADEAFSNALRKAEGLRAPAPPAHEGEMREALSDEAIDAALEAWFPKDGSCIGEDWRKAKHTAMWRRDMRAALDAALSHEGARGSE
jgi:hypothetical protein